MAKSTPKPISVPIESDAFRSDVAHAFRVVAERARELEVTGRTASDALLDASFDDPGDALCDHAARVRCHARHAAGLAVELEAIAGRLDGIALARQLIEHEMRSADTLPERSLQLRTGRRR